MEPSRARGPLLDLSEEEIPVYLKLVRTVACNVKPTETVKNFKALLSEKGIISENIQDLYFSGQLLKDGERLVDRGIKRNSSLYLFLRNFDEVKLLVKIPSEQRTILVEARADDTVQSIKSLIQVIDGIESDQFSLVYEGKLLEEDRTLSSLNIKNGSKLCLVFCQKNVLSINLKALTGEIVKLKVKVTFTVADVKAIAESMLGASVGSLFYLGEQLEDSKILACYDIKEESMLEMLHPLFQIFVKTWSGRTLTLYVKQSNTVQDVKDKIFQKLNLKIPVHLLSILFAGKRLEEGRDLASYNIQKHCTLCTVYAPSSTVIHMKKSEISGYIPHSTIGRVKKIIGSERGVRVKEVLFEEVALNDDLSLEHYGIDVEATIAVVY
ncbi:hypothetical protein DITRI_Ditri08aG0028400 [Diplodiscus trichospermus]